MDSMDSIVLTGELHSFDREPLKKKNVDIYDTNENLLGQLKTNKYGLFKVPLPLSIDYREIDIRFRVSTNHDPEKLDPSTQSVNARCASLWSRHDVKEDLIVPIKLNAPEISIGVRDMENLYESESVGFSYLKDIGVAAIPAVLQQAESKLKHLLGEFDSSDVQEIMDEFNVSDIPLTTENTWKFITDGICPTYFQRVGNQLIADINWNRYEMDKLEALPNVKLYFLESQDAEAIPELQKIVVHFRKTLSPSNKAEDFDVPTEYTPQDINFSEGLRIANSVFHLYGQAVFHLAIGHCYGAKIAQLVEDYLKDTKLEELLLPHCRYIRTISNVLGEDAIFGTNGVLNCSGLSVGGIVRRIQDTIAALDPFTYKPRTPINKDHKFANTQNIYYTSLREAVDLFIDENRADIASEWPQIHNFFFLLHKSSPLYRSWDDVPSETASWQSGSEIGLATGHNAPLRTKYRSSDDEVRSARWIARNPLSPEKNDMELVSAFITDYIHRVTFYHSWLHQTQFGEGGFTAPVAPHTMDANFSPITIAGKGAGPYGNIGKKDLLQQEEAIKIFRGFNGENYTLLNDQSVNPHIIAGIEKVKNEILKYQFDMEKGLYYSTVI